MIVQTESGSLYEIAVSRKMIRRLNETAGTSERTGYNGVWKDCADEPASSENLCLSPGVVV